MSDSRWYEDKKFRKLQQQWYAKLKKEDFFDVEGGSEGPYLRKTSSRGARLIVPEKGVQLYQHGSKARYYHFAQLLTAQAFRDLEDPEMCLVWAWHSQGHGERIIASELELPRARIRKHIRVLQKSLEPSLDARVKECNDVIDQEEQ